MHSSIANIAAEFSRRVPDELMGTRAAIFYLMARPPAAPKSVSTQIGAAFGRVMVTTVRPPKNSGARRPAPTPKIPATQDDFVFAMGPGAVVNHA